MAKDLWKYVDPYRYQVHVAISTIDSEDADESVVFMEDLEKRKQVYGICGECKEPGTGEYWCQPCNAKRFKDNFKNWTSGNKNIDEFLQQSQLNALLYYNYIEWVPFEKFQNITYITEGGFGKIYSAEWPEGNIKYWDIENQEWYRYKDYGKYALKSLNNSSDISSDFLNEVKSYLRIHLFDIVRCFGITQNPNTKEYMMVLMYCKNGNLRNYLNNSKKYINYEGKLYMLRKIAKGLLDIHNAGIVHKDFHSGNILHNGHLLFISDLGMCQPADKQSVKEGIYGVLPYVAPEILRGFQYTKAADIYSFGIIMNEFLSEETLYNDISHDEFLAIKICKGLRPKISEDIPKLLTDLIIKCWDAEIENRPTTKELCQILTKWNYGDNELRSQIIVCNKIGEKKFESRSSKDKPKNIQTHPQAIYTSRLLNFKNLPKSVNSSDLSSCQINSDTNTQSESANPISECLDVQLSELELNEIYQDNKNEIE
ncbi:kinase-like domain-containing protein [Rhizophagus diaphanus]|nr:kinase-like domain-containing protein [Rhizophagus diaphanus] [Rhizophagus sp. MUCL 43196]